jgi:hypothetical protein
MKAYILTTGSLFGLLAIVHIWRMVVESGAAKEPWVVGMTVLSVVLCVWAGRLLKTFRSTP